MAQAQTKLEPAVVVTDAKNLVKALTQVLLAVNTHSHTPILANVKLSADHRTGKLSITGTDLETRIIAEVPAVGITAGETTVSPKALKEMLKGVHGNVRLTFEADKLSLASADDLGWGIGSVTLPTLPAEDLPAYPPTDGERIAAFLAPTDNVRVAFLKCSKHASDEQARGATLMSTLLEIKGNAGAAITATDGYKMGHFQIEDAVVRDSFTGDQEKKGTGGKAIVVPVFARAMMKVLPKASEVEVSITVKANTTYAIAVSDGITVICRCVDGQYPNYEAVYPAKAMISGTVSIPVDEMIAAVTAAGKVASDRASLIKLLFLAKGNAVEINAESETKGKFTRLVAFTEPAPKPLANDMSIAFNAEYLASCLSSFDDYEQIEADLHNPLSPLVLANRTGDYCIIMPLRQ